MYYPLALDNQGIQLIEVGLYNQLRVHVHVYECVLMSNHTCVVILFTLVEEICLCFQGFGPLTIDWPHKVHSKSNVPPKGIFSMFV